MLLIEGRVNITESGFAVVYCV